MGMNEAAYVGPIDYLVFAFPAGARIGAGLSGLLDAVDRGHIEVLDLEVVGAGPDGRGIRLSLSDAAFDDDLAAFEGAESGLLDQDDLNTIAGSLDPGSFAVALLYLEHTLDAVAAEWAAAGGAPLLEGGIEVGELAAALDSAEPSVEEES